MSEALNKLLELFQLEQIEENIFRGVSHDLGFRSLFGGHVLGQALLAAAQTVEPDRHAHSLHAYFLRPGDAHMPIVYQVSRIRDGRGFTTRHVLAIQRGRPIFDMSCSFHIKESGFDHQDPMPLDVPPPESLKTEKEVLESVSHLIPERERYSLTRIRPVESRPVDPMAKVNPEPREPVKYVWFKAAGPMPDDPRLHTAVLAYASDFDLLGASMLPHGVSFMREDIMAASLDHALWIHRPFRVDEWLLYCMDSPSASGARGFTRGKIYTRDGVLVASVAQEGLVRRIATQ